MGLCERLRRIREIGFVIRFDIRSRQLNRCIPEEKVTHLHSKSYSINFMKKNMASRNKYLCDCVTGVKSTDDLELVVGVEVEAPEEVGA